MARAVRTMGMLALAGAVAAFAAPASAQVRPGSQTGLGLTGADIPPILKAVKAAPYRAPSEPACETIPAEIMALDEVLGPDVDGPRVKTGVAHLAVNYVRHMIPYRGWVRFVTRADSKDDALQAAATAGVARRGFLRGLEANLKCSPAAETKVATAPDLSDAIPADTVVADNRPVAPALQGDHLAKLMLVAAPIGGPAAPAPPAPQPAIEAAPTPGR